MDELGSGVRNVTKYIGIYAKGKKAQFIEGDMFRTIIPLDERLMTGELIGVIQRVHGRLTRYDSNEAVNDAVKTPVSDAVWKRLQEQIRFMMQYGGITLGTLKDVFSIKWPQ